MSQHTVGGKLSELYRLETMAIHNSHWPFVLGRSNSPVDALTKRDESYQEVVLWPSSLPIPSNAYSPPGSPTSTKTLWGMEKDGW